VQGNRQPGTAPGGGRRFTLGGFPLTRWGLAEEGDLSAPFSVTRNRLALILQRSRQYIVAHAMLHPAPLCLWQLY